jgi:hypothetical protein
MGKYQIGQYPPPRQGWHWTLSSGTVVDMTFDSLQEASEAIDNLLEMMAREKIVYMVKNHAKGIECSGIEIFQTEAMHLLENEIDDPASVLHWFISTLALDRYDLLINRIDKERDDE